MRNILRYSFLLVLIFVISCKQSNSEELLGQKSTENSNEIMNLRVTNSDSCIKFNWMTPENDTLEKIKIEYYMNYKVTIELDANQKTFDFTLGEHGKLYTFRIYTVDTEGIESLGITVSSLFIDYSKFDNPIMFINVPDNMEILTKTWLSDQNIDLADCSIIDNSNSANNIELQLDIKGRGNSSWSMPKKSYSLKLANKEKLISDANGKHKSYALIANYADKTLLRNELAYFMGNEFFDGFDWTPHYKNVNLFINGIYRGEYLLTERIKIDEKEINIPDVSKTNKLTDINNDGVINFSDGGWLVEINERLDEKFNWYTDNAIPISLKDPDDYDDWEKIKNYLNIIESVIYDDNLLSDVENGWRKYLDEDSFIDWYIINEITKNNDSCWYSSCYMYFNPSDKKIHMGPLWDYDLGFGNVNYNGCNEYNGFWVKNSGWYARLFMDSSFVNNVKNRWNEKKAEIESLNTIIDNKAQNISRDVELNFKIWKVLGVDIWPNPAGYETRTTFQSEVNYLKTWLVNRVNWLDIAINEL